MVPIIKMDKIEFNPDFTIPVETVGQEPAGLLTAGNERQELSAPDLPNSRLAVRNPFLTPRLPPKNTSKIHLFSKEPN